MKKIIVFILTLTMFISTFGVNVMATTSDYKHDTIVDVNKINNIVIFIKFKGDSDQSYNSGLITRIKQSYNGSSKSVKDFYYKESNQRLQINSIFPQSDSNNNIQVYEAPKSISEYSSSADKRKVLIDAFNSVKNKIGSDVNVDANNDGKVDAVTFFVAHENRNNLFLEWPHCSIMPKDDSTMLKGAYLSRYNLITTTSYNRQGYEVLAHEFGHVLDFPDFYSGLGNNSTMGSWTIQSANSGYHTVYERCKYTSWINESQIPTITSGGTYEISDSTKDPSKNTIGYKISVGNSSQYFMVEYRNKLANEYEGAIPDSGLLVSRIKPSENGNDTGRTEECVLYNKGLTVSQAALNESSLNKTIRLILEDGTDTGYAVNFLSKSNDKIKFRVITNNKAINFSNLSVSKNLSNVGETIDLESTATGGNNKLQYKFTYLRNSVETTISESTSNKCSFTPQKSGSYQIKCYVTDGISTEVKTDSIQVEDKYKAVIYYKKKSNLTGSKVYVHYNINNNGWNGLPGQEMEKISDDEYKAEVNLKKSDGTLTLCFTDGENHWDSKNGANYFCSVGTYTVQNETISKSNPQFSISYLSTEYGQCTVNGTVQIEADSINGNGIVEYKYTAINSSGKEQVIKDYTMEQHYINWRPTVVGKYTLKVEAKDSNNKVVSKTIPFNVVNLPTLSSSSFDKKSPQPLGSTININVNGTGGTGELQYQIIARGGNYPINEGGSRTIYVQNFNSNKSINWTPEMDGTYNLTVNIKDSTGAIKGVSLGEYEVKKSGLTIKSVIADKVSPQPTNSTINFTANTANGTGNVKYKYTFVSENGTKTVLNDYSNSNKYAWQPKKEMAGYILVEAKDELGNEADYKVDYSIKDSKDNYVTIYYKSSWNKTYCHYQVNGKWTVAPGVEMTNINAIEGGYNCKITINIGTANSIKCCFTDSNNHWDNNDTFIKWILYYYSRCRDSK